MYNNNNNGNEGNDYATTIRSLIQTVRKLQLSIDVAHEKKLDFDKEENRRVAEMFDPFMKLLHIKDEEELHGEIIKLGETAPDRSVMHGNCLASIALRKVVIQIKKLKIYSDRVADAFIFAEEQIKARENLKGKFKGGNIVENDSASVENKDAAEKKKIIPKKDSKQYSKLFESITITKRNNSLNMTMKEINEQYEIDRNKLQTIFQSYVVVLGTGAVGKIVADIFTRMGVEDLLLVDKQNVNSTDVLHHQFSPIFLNYNRAIAVTKELESLNYYNMKMENESNQHISIRPCNVDLSNNIGFNKFQKYLMMVEQEEHYNLFIKEEDNYVNQFNDNLYNERQNIFSSRINSVRKKRRPPNIIICTIHSNEIREQLYSLSDKLEIPLILIHLNKNGRSGMVKFRKPQYVSQRNNKNEEEEEENDNNNNNNNTNDVDQNDENNTSHKDSKKVPRIRWPSTIRIVSGIASDMAMKYIMSQSINKNDDGQNGRYVIKYDDRQSVTI